jgi:hypothetical protein
MSNELRIAKYPALTETSTAVGSTPSASRGRDDGEAELAQAIAVPPVG